MATRCTIKIEEIHCAKVYKHWDGYPDATLKWLETFNRNFNKNRDADPHYKFAQLLRDSIRNCSTFDLDPSQYTGWGVIPYDWEWNEEYEYILLANGEVTVKQL